uniref:Cyclin-dependent kinase C-2 n=1 Tax=Tanacetum cinerariifolium TaxID=118510 RepID=A0A6L2KMK2_TANCI|nr:cyclin-dependent kinase C-2 [Tanacetum cinerariifolium]
MFKFPTVAINVLIWDTHACPFGLFGLLVTIAGVRSPSPQQGPAASKLMDYKDEKRCRDVSTVGEPKFLALLVSDLIKKAKEGGLDVIQTYIFCNEPCFQVNLKYYIVFHFGLSKPYSKERKGSLTDNVVTLWHRPLELLLEATLYGPSVDMWLAGCIFT